MSALNIVRIIGAVGFLAITGYLAYAAVTLSSGEAALGAVAAGFAALVCLGAIDATPA
jgi:hypothetical protein